MRRTELLLFLATFFAFAYFNQGGGWNQNSRFAEVRAMVEEGRFDIDNFLVYRRDASSDDLVRVPVQNTAYDFAGKRYRLAWVDMTYSLIPMNPEVAGEDAPMIELCCSGDVGYVPKTTHFHPNKPPGTSFLAVPAYWVIYHIERAIGANPDHAWTMTLNAWLTTIFSVGLVSAIGCVLFFRLAREFAGGAELPAVLATLAFAFGTTFFPFGTILFDHNLTASVLIAAFYFLRKETSAAFIAAGVCAGLAVLTNYVAVGAVGALALYAFLANGSIVAPQTWSWRRGLLFAAGGIPLAVLLGYYHTVNFGSPFEVANNFQNPVFKDPAGNLGMFAFPTSAAAAGMFGYVSMIISISPYRGVFWLCPVLVAGLAGLGVWLWEKKWVAEARLCLAIFAFFFFINASFNGYHGGYAAGPRYLVPGIPFLAFGLVFAFARWEVIASAVVGFLGVLAAIVFGTERFLYHRTEAGWFGWLLAGVLAIAAVTFLLARWKHSLCVVFALSVAQQLLLTATDAQNSLAVGGHARLDDAHRKDDFWCNIVTEYAAPFFFKGRAEGLLKELLAAKLDTEIDRLELQVTDETERARLFEAKRAEWQLSIDQREQSPFLLAALSGPVSINPQGVYDGLLGFGNFEIHARQSQWNSHNLGEFLWPRSRWSLVPLLLVSGGVSWLAVRTARRGEAASKKQPLSS
ncbi:MAG: hypothetical protein WCF18_06365 [Chthoniobacteraceae bacterium]